MHRHALLIWLGCALVCAPGAPRAAEPLVVVASPGAARGPIQRSALRAAFVDGRHFTPVVTAAGSSLRRRLEREVLGLREGAMESEWVARRIRGRAVHARVVGDAASVAGLVAGLEDGIAVVPARLAAGLPIIYRADAAGTGAHVAPARQAAMLVRAALYDREREHAETLRVVVLHGPDDAGRAAALVEAYAGTRPRDLVVEARAVDVSDALELEPRLEGAPIDMVHVLTGVAEHIDALRALAQRRSLLTVAGERALVEAGLCAGVDAVRGRARLLVRRDVCAEQGVRFSAALLRVAERI